MSARVEWLGAPAWLGQGSHVSARPVIVRAFRAVFNREPTLSEAQLAQGVACVETGSTYDDTFYVNRVTGEQIRGTHNWGAIHCRDNPPCSSGCFEATDVGQRCFVRYSSADQGAQQLVRTLYSGRRASVLSAATAGSVEGVAQAMKNTGYYTAPLTDYTDSLRSCVERIARALGEPAPRSSGINARGLLPPLLLVGAAAAIFWGTLRPVARKMS